MRRYVVILMIWSLILFIMVSCAATKQVPITNNQVIKTEIKEVLKDTTIYVTLEKEVIKEIIKNPQDTTSTLSTKYATSTAKLENGTLHHQLKNKVDSIPTNVIYKDIIKIDSVYIHKEIPVNTPVPYIPKWCWWVICYAALISGIIIMKVVYKIRGR